MAELNDHELEIMNVLWMRGTLKPVEIQEALSQPIKNAALRWQLRELLAKGHVARKKKGKAFYYRAAVPRQRTFKQLTSRLANVFTGGSAVALIGELIESEDLSEEDIRELTRIARQKRAGKSA